jgi:hypothetical protein
MKAPSRRMPHDCRFIGHLLMPVQPQKLYGVQLRTKDRYKYKRGMNLGDGQEEERGKQLTESTKIATIKPSPELGARCKSTASSLWLGYSV